MSSEQKHSPLPWKQKDDYMSRSDYYVNVSSGDDLLFQISSRAAKNGYETAIANAALIVQAVNNHEKLVEALKKLVAGVKAQGVASPTVALAMSNARAVLASLERKEG